MGAKSNLSDRISAMDTVVDASGKACLTMAAPWLAGRDAIITSCVERQELGRQGCGHGRGAMMSTSSTRVAEFGKRCTLVTLMHPESSALCHHGYRGQAGGRQQCHVIPGLVPMAMRLLP